MEYLAGSVSRLDTIMNAMKKLMVVASLAVVGFITNANAVVYTFDQITANGNPVIEDQLSIDVTQSGSQALVTFVNAGPVASSITDIYFDDDANVIFDIDSIAFGAGVDFSIGATPGNLPGGNNASPAFSATAGLTADSNPPVSGNGVAPGEYLAVLLNLENGVAYDDLIAALDAGTFRVGMHVQAIGQTCGSESFVNSGRVVVPDAGMTVTMLGIALLAAGALRKRIG